MLYTFELNRATFYEHLELFALSRAKKDLPQNFSILRQALSFLLFFRFTQLCANIAATVEDADYGDLMQTGIR